MEAPVIFLEPPLILPKDQIKTDKEVGDLLKSTGLEKETKNRSSDPYQITSMDEAELAEKATKSEIAKLKQDRNDIFKRMRNMSMGMPDNTSLLSDYKVLKQELAEKDLKLKEEIVKLTQIEHVKAALVKRHGAGNDVREKEEELEDREDELTGSKGEEEDDEL